VSGKFEVAFLDDQARPPVRLVPERRMWVKPENMRHACEYCLVAEADGEKLQMCGRCKTARYCNAGCQRADWARHKVPDCGQFSHDRGRDSPLQIACMHGYMVEVRRLVEEEGADVAEIVRYLLEQGADKDATPAYTTGTGAPPLFIAARNGHLAVVRCLVEAGAYKDAVDSMVGATPLLIAVLSCRVDVVRYL